ncbi:MAG: hypothetical protein COY80_04555 [Candidatus Pacebacteria bacterium CG_4_10_14_0_8_um_filter_42_14]|nr:MAG: hypothetical protein COY80_04555 [Candidatus Pacebacteria bacterium CG_4_10_14_0_8_um_filter_42_14]
MPKPSRRISSRLLKHEKTKVVRQTWFFVFFSVVVLGLFVFVILPNFIGITATILGNNATPFAPADTLPPYTPTFTAPPKATTDAQLTLFGYAEPESDVIVIVNGQESEAVTAGSDGSFETAVILTEGDNNITTFARDKAGNESQQSRAYGIILDTEIPPLEISSPESSTTIQGRSNQTLAITGMTDPGVKITINGKLTYAKEDGSFSHSQFLNEGDNELTIVAADAAGNSIEKKLSVRFEL